MIKPFKLFQDVLCIGLPKVPLFIFDRGLLGNDAGEILALAVSTLQLNLVKEFRSRGMVFPGIAFAQAIDRDGIVQGDRAVHSVDSYSGPILAIFRHLRHGIKLLGAVEEDRVFAAFDFFHFDLFGCHENVSSPFPKITVWDRIAVLMNVIPSVRLSLNSVTE